MPACFRPCALASAIGTTLALFNAAHAAEHREALARWSGAIEERQNTSGEDRKSIKEGLSEIREDVSEIKARVSSIEGNCKVHSAILAAKQGANA